MQSELPNVQEPNLHVRIRNWDVSGMLLSRQLLTAKSHPNYKSCQLRNWDSVQDGHLRTVD
jgi:hypothetical protein